MAPFLRVEEITKTFPGVVANDRVTLEVSAREIHALLGENGAGKTTLVNILYGLHRPDSGRILLRGQEVHLHSSRHAIALGVGMVHQHFMLIPPLTVAENIVLGMRSPREPLLDLGPASREITRLSQAYGLEVDPSALVWQLSVGMQQRVEIIKALYRKADLLILDEPTAVLTPQEIHELFNILRRLKSEGHAVIFISHKLDEVMEISDRVTVLRDGRVVSTVETARTDKAALARMMVGRDVLFRLDKPPVTPGEPVLRVQRLRVMNDRGQSAIQDVSFDVHRNEVLGVAGVDGNGQRELVEAVAGLRPAAGGQIHINGQTALYGYPADQGHAFNVAHIPEDRQKVGLVLDFSVGENLVARLFTRLPFARYGFLFLDAIRRNAERLIKEFDIRVPHPDVKARALSGGNQQKVILARELSREPDLILAAQPTRGLDVGATEFVERRMLEQRARGAAILYVSTELEEILSLSDRIAVLHRGEIMGIVRPGEVTEEALGLMMAGEKRGTYL
ncbi:MAG TPA: ABC transporter ATP-binding protein [Anaerolineales bacterium]|nr:ABC transporter ATP-binding protein [Anaerolineales bacterium]